MGEANDDLNYQVLHIHDSSGNLQQHDSSGNLNDLQQIHINRHSMQFPISVRLTHARLKYIRLYVEYNVEYNHPRYVHMYRVGL